MIEKINTDLKGFFLTNRGIIKSRFIQTVRFLKDLGIIRSFICVVSVYCMLFVPVLTIKKSENSNLFYFLPILCILSLLNTFRKDKRFLQTVLIKEYLFESFEYFIITIPFLFFLFSRNEIILIIIFEFTIILLCYVQKKVGNARFRQYIPNIKIPINSLNYEWISGLKSNFIGLFFLHFTVIIVFFYSEYHTFFIFI